MIKPKFRVIVAGSRNFEDYEMLELTLNSHLVFMRKHFDVIIISGTAKGADKLGEKYATENGFGIERFPADWDAFGKKAGVIRNKQMADVADALVAFWNTESRGTKHMLSIAKKKGLSTVVYNF